MNNNFKKNINKLLQYRKDQSLSQTDRYEIDFLVNEYRKMIKVDRKGKKYDSYAKHIKDEWL